MFLHVSFYRIPKVVSNKGPELLSLSNRRREGYLKAISRVGVTEKILNNDRICSGHYKSGKPADLRDDTKADWLPTLYLGHSKSRQAKINPGETLRIVILLYLLTEIAIMCEFCCSFKPILLYLCHNNVGIKILKMKQ